MVIGLVSRLDEKKYSKEEKPLDERKGVSTKPYIKEEPPKGPTLPSEKESMTRFGIEKAKRYNPHLLQKSASIYVKTEIVKNKPKEPIPPQKEKKYGTDKYIK